MNMKQLLLPGVLAGLLAACGTADRVPAPVEKRTQVPAAQGEAGKVPAEQAPAGPGYYTVKQGDTLYRIALDAGQSYVDLVEWNKLNNPHDIKMGQVLRVVPPDSETAAVQPAQGMEVTPLEPVASQPTAATENMNAPRGDKQPYSEGTLGTMQDGTHKPAPVQQAAKPGVPKPAVPVPVPAVVPPVAGGSGGAVEGVAWAWPVNGGKVVDAFSASSKGMGIAGPAGQPVLAAADGKVMYAGSGIRGYGNLIILKHTNTLLTAYAHNRAILVKEGQDVGRGQKIAEMGNTDSSSVKLHFEVRKQGKPVDPFGYLPKR